MRFENLKSFYFIKTNSGNYKRQNILQNIIKKRKLDSTT